MPKRSALGRSTQILPSFLVLSREMRHLGAYSLLFLLRWFSLKKLFHSSVEVEELLLCKQEVNLQFLTFSKVEDQSGTRQRLRFIRYLSTWADTPAKSKVCVDFILGQYCKLRMDIGTGKVIPYNFIYCKERRQEKRNPLASRCCRRVSSVHSPPQTCIHSLTASVQLWTVSVTSRDSLYRLITNQQD